MLFVVWNAVSIYWSVDVNKTVNRLQNYFQFVILLFIIEADYAKHVYHIYAVRTKNRDALMNALAEKGIFCGIHYPIPVHLTEAYQFLGLSKGNFPITERCAEELVSLPMFPELIEHQIKQVVDRIKEFAQS